jgi:formylglycine-generating enzyme required for sulfatase activity
MANLPKFYLILAFYCAVSGYAQEALDHVKPPETPVSTSEKSGSPFPVSDLKKSGPSKIELACRMTLKEYIERYTGGEDVGCSIGGQVFRNFKVRIQSSLDVDKLKGEHPSLPLTAEQIIVTPVNYVKDGRRWIGFRFTNTESGFEILGGPKLPKDYAEITKKGHHISNCGFTSNYDIRFEVHGSSKWERGKVGYTGLMTQRLIDGKWSDKNLGPGSRGNLGWYPKKIGLNGGYTGTNPKSPQAHGMARLSSVSKSFSDEAIAPTDNESWFMFDEATAPTAFEVRAGYAPQYLPGKEPGLYTYGIWFRMNCWDNANTRWFANYIEYSFSNSTLSPEICPNLPAQGSVQPTETLTKQPVLTPTAPGVFTGETKTIDVADGISMKLVRIPAGSFIMGTSETEVGRADDEGPQRVVTISKPFYIGVYEVTQEQYQAIMGQNPKKWKDPMKAVDNAHFSHVQEYCAKLSAKTGKQIRLPTEAEWEYACRAGTQTRFHFGDDAKQLPDFACFMANANKTSSVVGQKKPNAWALHDMHGNMWEWCSDWYDQPKAASPVVDPQGSKSGEAHVARGGSWSYHADGCRSASRLKGTYSDLQDSGIVGFRIVLIDEEKP